MARQCVIATLWMPLRMRLRQKIVPGRCVAALVLVLSVGERQLSVVEEFQRLFVVR